jgi:hypothetical protein
MVGLSADGAVVVGCFDSFLISSFASFAHLFVSSSFFYSSAIVASFSAISCHMGPIAFSTAACSIACSCCYSVVGLLIDGA